MLRSNFVNFFYEVEWAEKNSLEYNISPFYLSLFEYIGTKASLSFSMPKYYIFVASTWVRYWF